MILEIDNTKCNPSPTSFDLTDQNFITLIGGNGSGKSAILEALFNKYLSDNEVKVIGFSSGQNESFSKTYIPYFKQNIKDTRTQSWNRGQSNLVESFYFDVNWSRFLIFFASVLKPDGHVRNYLKEKGYVSTRLNGSFSEDISSVLEFDFKILSPFVRHINNQLAAEARDPNHRSIRNTFIFAMLERLIEFRIQNGYNWDTPIPKRSSSLSSNDIFRISSDIPQFFTFLTYVTYNNNIIDISSCKLKLTGELEANDLSDGEHQLLSIYSMLDLFDANNTLFLFDEIDSHLYFENISQVWEKLRQINGRLITTTHSADSLLLNDYNNIKLVDEGKIDSKNIANKLFQRLGIFSQGDSFKYKFASKFRYIALIEGVIDWFIFKKLAQIKLGQNFNPQVLDTIHIIEQSSNYDGTFHRFGNNKIDWVSSFNKANDNTSITDRVFMICDKDHLSPNEINGVSVSNVSGIRRNRIDLKNNGQNAYLLSWKRRDIENYLLSHTMLTNNSINILSNINSLLPSSHHLQALNSCDTDSVRNVDIKSIIQPLYTTQDSSGTNYNTLEAIINQIPPSEISEDIENMYNYILGKIDLT
jgi:ABC-type cobalamin/Fe3+-siderophores transport system ATPase subunit